MNFILASSSPSRRQILSQLRVPFEVSVPDVDETPLPGETASALVQRLARRKAEKVAGMQADQAWIVASDQVAELEGRIVGKPHSFDDAHSFLMSASGKVVFFRNGQCLLNTEGSTQVGLSTIEVHYRPFTPEQAEHYLRCDEPYGCAGSLKVESLGIGLIKKIVSDDPNTLVGLSLITLFDMFLNEGIDLLSYAQSAG